VGHCCGFTNFAAFTVNCNLNVDAFVCSILTLIGVLDHMQIQSKMH